MLELIKLNIILLLEAQNSLNFFCLTNKLVTQ